MTLMPPELATLFFVSYPSFNFFSIIPATDTVVKSQEGGDVVDLKFGAAILAGRVDRIEGKKKGYKRKTKKSLFQTAWQSDTSDLRFEILAL
ncbi:hypothetical protein SDJN03_01548, partial [Cucurbita argyrosperma subsp. sororia]